MAWKRGRKCDCHDPHDHENMPCDRSAQMLIQLPGNNDPDNRWPVCTHCGTIKISEGWERVISRNRRS